MAGILGWGGQVLLTINGRTKAIGDLLRFRIDVQKEELETTTQADEDRESTAGIRQCSGIFEFNTRFYEDEYCWSSYQLLQHMLTTTDDNSICFASFRVQDETSQNCNDTRSEVSIYGNIIVDMSIDLSYDAPVVSTCNWRATGPLTLATTRTELTENGVEMVVDGSI